MPATKTPSKRKLSLVTGDEKNSKKVKVHHMSHNSEAGQVLVLGQGDVGQLGLGEDLLERKKPAPVSLPEDIVQVVAGGMHTVALEGKVVQASAGDSHTAALTDDGAVYLWGCFRDNNGVIGLLEPMKKSSLPVHILALPPVVKIVSGNDHLVMLTAGGVVYTCGCGEQGQLGRVPELFTDRGGRRGLGT
ncbi:hypothetical protein CRUP_021704 [Coryphaenoides rupestris]|nr:hypothetical protein CRUP_021704 [Coryphaenoides rupestris]